MLGRGAKRIIADAITATDTTDRHVLCAYICQHVEERYKGQSLEYQLSRMDMDTTKKILMIIDEYNKTHRNGRKISNCKARRRIAEGRAM